MSGQIVIVYGTLEQIQTVNNYMKIQLSNRNVEVNFTTVIRPKCKYFFLNFKFNEFCFFI